MNRPIEISVGPYPRGQLHPLRVEGHEGIQELSWFDVDLWAKDLDETTFDAAALGANATVFLEAPPVGQRIIAGLVVSVASQGSHEAHRHAFRLRVAPRAWLLQKREQSRIFQDKTIPEIVALVLDEHRVVHSWRLHSEHRRREYCVQYQESDWAFLTRVLAEEGIFFWFVAAAEREGADVMVLGDHARSYAPIAGVPTLSHRGPSALAGDLSVDQISQFRAQTRIEPAASELRDYDFRRPKLDPARRFGSEDPACVKVPGAALEVFEHRGAYEPHGEPCDARVFLEQLRAEVRTAEAISACRLLSPGATFDLVDHELPSLDRAWVVTSVHHVATAAEFVLPAAQGGRQSHDSVPTYENRLRCVPASVPYRLGRPPRQHHHAVETAVVVGPPGQEIHTDAYGRIRVQFPWDRVGALDEHSSCFLRVAQPWAGAGWGHQFIPRVGMEVLVAFVGGDPDQPLVIGAVPNAETPSPFALPANSTRSGIRTRSTPGGGGSNELAFEDLSGAEQIYLHAQRDLDEEIGHDRTCVVGNDRTATVQGHARSVVHRTRTDRTLEDATEAVGGSLTVEVGGHEARKIAKTRTVEVGAGESHLIAGGLALSVHRDRTSRVGDTDSLVVGGDRSTTVRGEDVRSVCKESRTIVGGGASVTVAGPTSFGVGTAAHPASLQGQVAGDICMQGGGVLELISTKMVRLRVGRSLVTIAPDEVRIDADAITLRAKSVTADGGGATLSLAGAANLGASTVQIHSAGGAVLQLDGEAKLDGPAVKLKPGIGAEMAKVAEREEQVDQLDRVPIHLFDRVGQPIANAPYEVSFFGYLDEGIAPGGIVEVPAFPDVEKAHVRWGRPMAAREYPDDAEPYEFEMDVFMVTSQSNQTDSLSRKLHNLGYPGSLTEAVYGFQAALGVERTGRLEDVAAEVEARHAQLQPVRITTKGA